MKLSEVSKNAVNRVNEVYETCSAYIQGYTGKDLEFIQDSSSEAFPFIYTAYGIDPKSYTEIRWNPKREEIVMIRARSYPRVSLPQSHHQHNHTRVVNHILGNTYKRKVEIINPDFTTLLSCGATFYLPTPIQMPNINQFGSTELSSLYRNSLSTSEGQLPLSIYVSALNGLGNANVTFPSDEDIKLEAISKVSEYMLANLFAKKLTENN